MIAPTLAAVTPGLRRQIASSDDERLRRAFRMVRNEAVARHAAAPTPSELVFAVLIWAVEIERKQPNKERAWLKMRSVWPDVPPSAAEHRASAMKLVRLMADGFDPAEHQSSQPYASDVSTAEAVLRIFARSMVGQQQPRDAKILYLLARGRSGASIGREFNLSRAVVSDRKNLQCAAIAKRLARLLPGMN